MKNDQEFEKSVNNVVLKLSQVKKTYSLGETRIEALKGIDLQVSKGQVIGLVGASGSGKSTLLNIMGCLDRPDSGIVELMGKDLAQCTDDQISQLRNLNLGFVFQSFNLIPVLTVFENIEVPLLLRKDISLSEKRKRVLDAAKAVGLDTHLQHRPDSLSGGQRQRVAIARALVSQPQVVFADEPTANLDSENANRIVDLILELGRSFKTTFVIASHDERLLSKVQKRWTIVDGRIQTEREGQIQ